ncbi:MAG: hypothetical protein CVV50_05255 [Spirochaetae bacterium HGW-Spirochaetae-6]|nr:MAG: hypothetical protein CVV50_05255 [Spirochaetae bacterium HGW-Spirochaetae-6]
MLILFPTYHLIKLSSLKTAITEDFIFSIFIHIYVFAYTRLQQQFRRTNLKLNISAIFSNQFFLDFSQNFL